MPSFKKIISAVCAAAMLSTVSLVPVLADDDTDIIGGADG